MRIGLFALVLVGCSPGPLPVRRMHDAATDDGQAQHDGRTGDTGPSWQVIETLQVDSASANPVTSTTVLASGVTYRLRASGVVMNAIDAHSADADYYDFNAPKDHGCCEDFGLGIDDVVVSDKDTRPDWGPYTPTHVYEVAWDGGGRTITALFQDTYYGNNVGILTLEILAYQ